MRAIQRGAALIRYWLLHDGDQVVLQEDVYKFGAASPSGVDEQPNASNLWTRIRLSDPIPGPTAPILTFAV